MILQPTVLILGAGASAPYGYPLGAKLVSQIIDHTGPAGPIRGLFPGDPTVLRLHERLRDSEVSSIDDFLESNPDFAELGKLCIAAALTVFGPGHDHVPQDTEHWYGYLWRRLHEGAATAERFRGNRLRIITFNYDRSLERFFVKVVKAAYPDLFEAKAPEVSRFVEEVLPVVHLHGVLDPAADAVIALPDRSGYVSETFFRQVAAGIRIVHEDQPTEAYDTAHSWLSEAKYVHLLGFGFHPTNVRRLDLVTQSRHAGGWQGWGGTGYGLQEAEVNRAVNALQMGTNRQIFSLTCQQYLRSRAVLD